MIVCILLYVSYNTCVLNERILDLGDRKIVNQIEIPYYFRGKLEQLGKFLTKFYSSRYNVTWYSEDLIFPLLDYYSYVTVSFEWTKKW